VQSAVVKFRLTPAQKARLTNAAESADTSMSALLRRSAMIAAAGRPLDRNARLDIAAMRAAANALLSAIDDIGDYVTVHLSHVFYGNSALSRSRNWSRPIVEREFHA
jgi:hypothetical protein